MTRFRDLIRFSLPTVDQLAAFDRGRCVGAALADAIPDDPGLREALAFLVHERLGPRSFTSPRIDWFTEAVALVLPVPEDTPRPPCPFTGEPTPLPHHRALALVRERRARQAAVELEPVLPWPLPIQAGERARLLGAAWSARDVQVLAVAHFASHLAGMDFNLRRAESWACFRARFFAER
ncbi:MAG: hypothetical protein EA356_13060 [Geminicoccaceae bacterium]|nr:MAG: hypothetical protein EA356_13060 [Geminicoccaceae bacterium]